MAKDPAGQVSNLTLIYMHSFHRVNYVTFGISSKVTLNSFCRTRVFNRDACAFDGPGFPGRGGGAGGREVVLYFGSTIEKNQCRRMA